MLSNAIDRQDDALEQFHKIIDSFYLQITQTHQGVGKDKVKRFLTSDDQRFGYPEKEVMLKYTMADLKRWMEHALKESAIDISIVGDIDPDEATNLVAKTLGALPSRHKDKLSLTEERKVFFPQHTKCVSFPYISQTPITHVSIVWAIPDNVNYLDYRKLLVLDYIFENNMRKKLRENRGQVYSPSAHITKNTAFTKYEFFSANVCVQKSLTESVISDIIAIADDIVQNGIDDTQFRLAMNPLMEYINKLDRDNDYWMIVLKESKQYPDKINNSRTYKSFMQGLTTLDIHESAKKYLNPENIYKIIVYPTDF